MLAYSHWLESEEAEVRGMVMAETENVTSITDAT
jgi:hypothetical protein